MVHFRKIAAALGLVIIATIVGVAPPAMAQVPMFPMGPPFGYPRHHFGVPVICVTDYQLRQNLAQSGFTHIYLNAPTGRTIQARATRGRWVYLVEMDSCSGVILSVDPLRPS
jgi:hypothetical protein